MTAAQLRSASTYLKQQDPNLARLISLISLEPTPPSDPWWELVDSIVSQQLSVKAASTILGRVEAIFGHQAAPSEFLKVTPEALRDAGLSGAKVTYVRDLAGRVEEGSLELGRLPTLSDEDVIAELTAVKGIGRWTAEMFLIFHLGRPDVLPVDDLGFREATKRLYRLTERPAATELTALGKPWRPYRSVATRYLWKSLALAETTDRRARPA